VLDRVDAGADRHLRAFGPMRVRGRPRLCQQPTAILIATSTAVDPESEKNA